jgi:hypothetical protein
MSGHRHVPAALLPPGKGPPVSIGQEAGWALEPVWTQRIEEKSFCLWRDSNPDRPVVQPVVRHYTPELTRLQGRILLYVFTVYNCKESVEVKRFVYRIFT